MSGRGFQVGWGQGTRSIKQQQTRVECRKTDYVVIICIYTKYFVMLLISKFSFFLTSGRTSSAQSREVIFVLLFLLFASLIFNIIYLDGALEC